MSVLDDLERLVSDDAVAYARVSVSGVIESTKTYVVLPREDAEALIRAARAAERLGFTSTESPLYEALQPLTKEDA